MKKRYINPSIEVIDTELDNLMTDMWSKTNVGDGSGTGGGGAGGAGGGPGGGGGGGGPAAKEWFNHWGHGFGNFEDDEEIDFSEEE